VCESFDRASYFGLRTSYFYLQARATNAVHGVGAPPVGPGL
jgi:hypothetical protein